MYLTILSSFPLPLTFNSHPLFPVSTITFRCMTLSVMLPLPACLLSYHHLTRWVPLNQTSTGLWLTDALQVDRAKVQVAEIKTGKNPVSTVEWYSPMPSYRPSLPLGKSSLFHKINAAASDPHPKQFSTFSSLLTPPPLPRPSQLMTLSPSLKKVSPPDPSCLSPLPIHILSRF